MRIVGERLSVGGTVLLETALRDPARPYVDAAWHTGGSTARMRAPFPDDQLGTALLPLRVSGRTDAQRRVIAAAEQMVVALRSVFFCDPDPDAMRVPVRPGSGRLMTGCDNFADVVFRTRAECALLKGIALRYVMRRPGAAGRYERQREILTSLVQVLATRAPDGLDRVFAVVRSELPHRLHDTAYALAFEVAAVDLEMRIEELRILQLLRRNLEIDQATIEAIERAAKARHRTLT